MTPCTDLSSGQTVTVQGRGFKPSLRVLAVECAYHGTATTSNDCNVNLLRLPVTRSPNADGTVTLTLIVQKTFRAGGTSFTCAGDTHCIVAVAAPKDTSENATAPIYFH